MAETGADPSMAIRKVKTRGFGSGSPASALVLSLTIDFEHQVLKTLTSIVPVYNVLECLTGIPFNVFWLFAGFQLNQDSTTILLQDKMGVDVATSSLRFHGDFPAL